MRRNTPRWDFFICYASEDKSAVAKPLADILASRGLRVWYDDFSLKVGDSLRRKIEHGLERSNFGIVIISPNFFRKEWPQRELDMLVQKQIRSKRKKILPVWHEVDQNAVAKKSLALIDLKAAKTADGLETVANEILKATDNRGSAATEPSSFSCRPSVQEEFLQQTCHPHRCSCEERSLSGSE